MHISHVRKCLDDWSQREIEADEAAQEVTAASLQSGLLLCRGLLRTAPPRGQWGGAGGSLPVRGRGRVLVFWRLRHGGRRTQQVSGERHLDAASQVQR